MTTPITDTYRTDWANRRASWEQRLAQPHDWLSAVAVNRLDDTHADSKGCPACGGRSATR